MATFPEVLLSHSVWKRHDLVNRPAAVTEMFRRYVQTARETIFISWGATFCAKQSSSEYMALVEDIERRLIEGIRITLVCSWTLFVDDLGKNALVHLVENKSRFPGLALFSRTRHLPGPHGIATDQARGFLESLHNETDMERFTCEILPKDGHRFFQSFYRATFYEPLRRDEVVEIFEADQLRLVSTSEEFDAVWAETSRVLRNIDLQTRNRHLVGLLRDPKRDVLGRLFDERVKKLEAQ